MVRLEQLDAAGRLHLVKGFEDDARHVLFVIFVGPEHVEELQAHDFLEHSRASAERSNNCFE